MYCLWACVCFDRPPYRSTNRSNQEVQQEEKLLHEDVQDRKAMWSHYPTLRVLKSVFWIAGILTGVSCSGILMETGA